MSFSVDTELGVIKPYEDTVWTGMSRRYVTTEYTVEFFGYDDTTDSALNHERDFDVKKGERPSAALGRAKDYVREFVAQHADALERLK